jgi:hypothetical protein
MTSLRGGVHQGANLPVSITVNVLDASGDVTAPSSVGTSEPQLAQHFFRINSNTSPKGPANSIQLALRSHHVEQRRALYMFRYASSPDVGQDPCKPVW